MRGTRNSFIFLLVVTTASLLAACGANLNSEITPDGNKIGASELNKVIYGEDGRLDYGAASSMQKALADSTVALIKTDNLKDVNGILSHVLGSTFSSEMNLCTSERFGNQILGAFCSGSLVGEDLILTAGHCIANTYYCNTTSFVFGFYGNRDASGQDIVKNSDIYHCKEILHTQQIGDGADYAVIRLDRPVRDHRVLSLRRTGQIAVGTEVMVIGHPVGLPTKITVGGKVRALNKGYFVTNLDTYGGNSGSAVFDSQTGLIEGILVRGENDFVPNGMCNVSNHCTDTGCRGEDVTFINEALTYIPGSVTPPPTPNPTPTPNPDVPREYASTVAMQIPDNLFSGISSFVMADIAPAGKKVFIKVKIEHPWVGDLVLSVVAPDGTEIALRSRKGGSAKNLIGIFGKDLQAEGDLSRLAKVTKSGKWTLKVSDRILKDSGSLKGWSVIIDTK